MWLRPGLQAGSSTAGCLTDRHLCGDSPALPTHGPCLERQLPSQLQLPVSVPTVAPHGTPSLSEAPCVITGIQPGWHDASCQQPDDGQHRQDVGH